MNRSMFPEALTEARAMYFKNGTRMDSTKATLSIRPGRRQKMKGGLWVNGHADHHCVLKGRGSIDTLD